MATNPYSGIPMDHLKVAAALAQAGVEGLKEAKLNDGKLLQYTGTFKEIPFMVKIFLNKKGHCTIGQGTGFDKDTYDVLAEVVANHCQYGEKQRLELAVPKFEVTKQEPLIDYLKSLGAKVETDEKKGNYRQLRVAGPQGHPITHKSPHG